MNPLENTIASFLIEKSRGKCQKLGVEENIDENFSFTGSGVFDSMDFIDLISQVEKKFNIEIDFSDYEPNDFSTIKGFAHCAVLTII